MFRFTIRDVLWLMVVVGLGISLYATRTALQEERQEREHQVEHLEFSRELNSKSHDVLKKAWKREADLQKELDDLKRGIGGTNSS